MQSKIPASALETVKVIGKRVLQLADDCLASGSLKSANAEHMHQATAEDRAAIGAALNLSTGFPDHASYRRADKPFRQQAIGEPPYRRTHISCDFESAKPVSQRASKGRERVRHRRLGRWRWTKQFNGGSARLGG